MRLHKREIIFINNSMTYISKFKFYSIVSEKTVVEMLNYGYSWNITALT